MRWTTGPGKTDPSYAVRQHGIEFTAPYSDAGRIGVQVGYIGRDRFERGVHQVRQTRQSAMRCMAWHISPSVEVLLDAGDVRQHRAHFGAATHDQLLAAVGDQRDVTRELDRVAIALVAHHQQTASRYAHAVPSG